MNLVPIGLAGALLLATHLGFSATGLRDRFAARVGEGLYLAFFSLVSLACFALLIWVYRLSPRTQYFWYPAPELYQISQIIMAGACLLLAGSLLVRNPSTVGQGALLGEPAGRAQAVRGVNRITRHPFLWGVALWSIAHLVANGDRASVVLFGTLLVLALLGTRSLDAKKQRQLGADWEAFAATTSNVPFTALLRRATGGRTRPPLPALLVELGGAVLAAAALYAACYFGHRWIAGVGLS